MGDAADDSFDDFYDSCDLYDEGLDWDEYGPYIGPPRNSGPKEIICKFCKERGFHWKQLPNGQWRLFDKYGMHSCKGKTDGKQNSSQSSTPI